MYIIKVSRNVLQKERRSLLQVNPAHSAILFLITKIWDAINDPIIGALVDSKKDTGKGKFIPWIRAFALPMAVTCVLGFANISNWSAKFTASL